MINISKEIREKIQNGQAKTHAKIVIDDRIFGYDNKNNTQKPVDDGSIVKLDLQYDISENEFAIGTACIQTCEVTLYGASDFEFEKKYLTIYIGYELDEKFIADGRQYPKIEWLTMGTFFTTEITKKREWVSFIGYDRMYKYTDMIYVPSASLGSNPTVYDVFMDIFRFTGVSYDADSFENMMTARVDMKLLYGTDSDGNTTGYTVRDAMAFLSGKAGGIIIVNRYDKFKFLEYSFAVTDVYIDDFDFEQDYLITDRDVSNFEIMGDGVHGMRYIDVATSNAVIRYDNGNSQYKNGIVLDNPIITEESEAKAVLNRINRIYAKKNGIFYMTPCIFKLLNGDISLELGDILTYAPQKNYANGEQSYIPIMHMGVLYTGKPEIELAAYNKTETQQKNRTGPIGRRFTAFKRAADNKYKYLDEAITNVSNQVLGANGGYIVVDKNEDGSWRQIRVLDSIENPQTAIFINKNGIGFSDDVNKEPLTAAFTIDGKIVANSMTGGILQAAQGYIGNWNIEENSLYSDYGDNRVFLSTPKGLKEWAISTRVKKDGYDTGTFILYANGEVFHGRNMYMKDGYYIYSGTPGETGVGDAELMLGRSSAGHLAVGTTGQRGDTNIYSSSTIRLAMGEYSNCVTFSSVFNLNTRTTFISLDGLPLEIQQDLKVREKLDIYGRLKLHDSLYLSFATVSGTIPLQVNSTGEVIASSSSKRYKENITEEFETTLNPKKLYDCPVKQYNYKEEFKDKELVEGTQIGIIAEDVDKYYPNACIYNAEGQPESWQERIMIPAMLKLIQEQKKQIDNLEERVKALEGHI